MAKKKVAIKIGHTDKAKGAYSPTISLSEFDFNSKVAEELQKLCGCDIQYDVFTFDPNVSSYTQRQKKVADKLNEDNYDLVVELHFDSAESHTAKGTTVLYYHKSANGKEAAKVVGDAIYNEFKVNRRSDIALSSDTQNGYQAVVTPKAVAILVEPFFGSNPEEAILFDKVAGRQRYAKALDKGIKQYLKIS